MAWTYEELLTAARNKLEWHKDELFEAEEDGYEWARGFHSGSISQLEVLIDRLEENIDQGILS